MQAGKKDIVIGSKHDDQLEPPLREEVARVEVHNAAARAQEVLQLVTDLRCAMHTYTPRTYIRTQHAHTYAHTTHIHTYTPRTCIRTHHAHTYVRTTQKDKRHHSLCGLCSIRAHIMNKVRKRWMEGRQDRERESESDKKREKRLKPYLRPECMCQTLHRSLRGVSFPSPNHPRICASSD